MGKQYHVAVVGATGAVGAAMVRILAERTFPVGRLSLYATARTAGTAVPWRGAAVTVQDVATADFAGVDIALFAGGEIASTTYVPKARAAGAICIDNSSAYRMDPAVPLVVPEVNPEALREHHGVVANPNCSTIQMVMALKPLHDAAGVEREQRRQTLQRQAHGGCRWHTRRNVGASAGGADQWTPRARRNDAAENR